MKQRKLSSLKNLFKDAPSTKNIVDLHKRIVRTDTLVYVVLIAFFLAFLMFAYDYFKFTSESRQRLYDKLEQMEDTLQQQKDDRQDQEIKHLKEQIDNLQLSIDTTQLP
ncbi:MAG: hypothetical protein FVQ77_00175 [Cytophagales bacterium]|nr:hypothetical protein [Cytophagales bacterium]